MASIAICACLLSMVPEPGGNCCSGASGEFAVTGSSVPTGYPPEGALGVPSGPGVEWGVWSTPASAAMTFSLSHTLLPTWIQGTTGDDELLNCPELENAGWESSRFSLREHPSRRPCAPAGAQARNRRPDAASASASAAGSWWDLQANPDPRGKARRLPAGAELRCDSRWLSGHRSVPADRPRIPN